MIIVYVYPNFTTIAGTERVLIDKMNYFVERDGFDVVLITLEQGVFSMPFMLSRKVKHFDLDVCFYKMYHKNIIIRQFEKQLLMYVFQRRFNNIMNELQPDIVITTTYDSKVLSVIDNCKVKYKRVVESHIGKAFLHQNDPINKVNILRWFNAYMGMKKVEYFVKRSDVLVALNQADACDWSRYVDTKVITNVVHLNPLGRYSNQNNNRIIFVGRFTKQKGLNDLFRIWKLVNQIHPDWHLDLFGDGEMRSFVCSEAERLGMNIHINESNNNIFERYINSSILVLTSVYEPFGLVIPEAMSCGLPVVSFDCPYGPADIITDGVDGFLVKNRNIEDFAARVCSLIESRNLRIQMGQAAIMSSSRYRPEMIMPQWESLFEKLNSEKDL